MKEYNIGDVVYWAHGGREQVEKICPICFGKKVVHLILGDESCVELPCDYCAQGYDPPRGVIFEWEYVKEVIEAEVSEKRVEEREGKRKVEYLHGNTYMQIEDMFDSREEALARSEVLESQFNDEQSEAFIHSIARGKTQRYSWKAGYHKREAKRSREEAERHEKAALVCKSRSRTKDV